VDRSWSRNAAGIDEQHQRQQTNGLWFVRHQRHQQPAEPDRLATQVLTRQPYARTGRVPLVEDQVHHREHGPQPVRQVGLVRHPVGDASVTDLAFRAHQPLGHGRFGNQERVRDLGGGEPAEQPQCQRDLR
jgi:hypothetical protein